MKKLFKPISGIRADNSLWCATPVKVQSGFTLLEVMAALAILGIGIVMVIQMFSGGLGLVKASENYTMKVLLAKEKMTETLLTGKLREGVTRGVTDNGFIWAVEISPYDQQADGGADADARIFKIVVSADGPGALKKSFTLTTLKTVF